MLWVGCYGLGAMGVSARKHRSGRRHFRHCMSQGNEASRELEIMSVSRVVVRSSESCRDFCPHTTGAEPAFYPAEAAVYPQQTDSNL